jgi:predicted phosphodiesterase
MKICVVGDIHGDIVGMYSHLLYWQRRTGIELDAILHVGDFGIYLPDTWEDESPLARTHFRSYWEGKKTAPIPTWVCPGNHEDIRVINKWQAAPNQMQNLHLLADGAITAVNGVKVGAIWGNFSFRSWENEQRVITARRQHPVSPKSMHISRSSVQRLKRAGEFDILITHDAPAQLMHNMKQPSMDVKHKLGLDGDERAHGCPGFNELYQTGKPQYHFFGHFHSFYVCQQIEPLVVALHCFNYNREQSMWVLEF